MHAPAPAPAHPQHEQACMRRCMNAKTTKVADSSRGHRSSRACVGDGPCAYSLRSPRPWQRRRPSSLWMHRPAPRSSRCRGSPPPPPPRLLQLLPCRLPSTAPPVRQQVVSDVQRPSCSKDACGFAGQRGIARVSLTSGAWFRDAIRVYVERCTAKALFLASSSLFGSGSVDLVDWLDVGLRDEEGPVAGQKDDLYHGEGLHRKRSGAGHSQRRVRASPLSHIVLFSLSRLAADSAGEDVSTTGASM